MGICGYGPKLADIDLFKNIYPTQPCILGNSHGLKVIIHLCGLIIHSWVSPDQSGRIYIYIYNTYTTVAMGFGWLSTITHGYYINPPNH